MFASNLEEPAAFTEGTMITLETSEGNIAFELYADDAPKTVENFLKLARGGYYDGLSFHRVIPGFMIQGGDPNCGRNGGADAGACGAGGPGYQFEDELNPATASYRAGYKKGVLAMANAGPNTNGSQFFIMVADYPLPHNYTIFGRVTAGQEVADAISKTPRNQNDRPLTPVVMKRVVVAP
ncbi:MAG: peptidylprolyl isomerase [Candidatus Harrisonbacteria bacterium]|nr:peptidylprolyl isomerase [Candidatus Harrisonbacteria bacterium]